MNKIIIDSDISYWGYSARWLKSKLADMTGDLEVEISSYGGDVFEGIAMFNMLRQYATTKGKVTTITNSHAMSIASLIFLAGDTKKAYENSTIMIHKAWTWLAGNSDELKAESKILDGIDTILAKQYSKYMQENEDEIMKIMSKEGWFIGKDQMQSTGFVDEFISSDREVDISARSNFKKAMARFSAKAKEENVQPDFDEVRLNIIECNNGKCPMDNSGVNHSGLNASAQIKNSTEGISMEYTKEKFEALEASHAEALTDANAQLETAVASIATIAAEKTTAVEALVTLQETVDAKAEVMPEVMAMAFDRNVDKATLTAMAQADTLDGAKVALVDSVGSDGAFGAQEENNGEVKATWYGHFNNK